jgi:glyoxylase-like metal-dependent hydrolase (beta-lactamase superfamily II)
VHETPGHAPSHVCLYQPERRLLISGDHLLGRISLFFEHGNSPDPVAQFLDSLDRVQGLGARLALSGHGKPFLDVPGHIDANRELVAERLAATEAALSGSPRTAVEIAPTVFGEPLGFHNGNWLLSQTLCYLEHLERAGRARRDQDGDAERWTAGPGDNLDIDLSRL